MIPRNVQITLVLLLVAILGSGIYILQLRRHTQDNLRRAADQHPLGPPVAGVAGSMKLTIAFDDDGVLRSREVTGALPAEPSGRARQILETLLAQYVNRPSPHELAETSAVNNVFLINQKFAVIDMNQAFAEGHRSGVMVEDFTLLSLIDTLAANLPQIEQVKILIDGKERETLAGHADLKSTYSTAAVRKVIAQLP